MRKQLYYIVLVLLVSVHLSSCKEDPIPTVSLEMLPTELVGLGETMLFDTLPYTITEYISDTITPDSIVVDTLVIDTFNIDTFWMDTICLFGAISYAGDALTGPALHLSRIRLRISFRFVMTRRCMFIPTPSTRSVPCGVRRFTCGCRTSTSVNMWKN